AVARDIARNDRSKTPRCVLRMLAALARFKVPNFAHGPDSVSSDRKRQCRRAMTFQKTKKPDATYHTVTMEQAN
ncbi:MAG: hypothetical protein ACREC2_11185, partial [Bradyrhizobium sp.]